MSFDRHGGQKIVIRLSGVVRLANRVQRTFSRPVTAVEREQVRLIVEQSLLEIEKILERHGAHADALPSPTRRALGFLRNFDFSQVVASGDAESCPMAGGVSLTGIVAEVERIAESIALDRSDAFQRLTGLAAQVARVQARWGPGMERFTPRTREHIAWVRFLADAKRFEFYRSAVRILAGAIDLVPGSAGWPRPICVQFQPTQSAYRVRVVAGRTRCVVPTAMLGIERSDFDRLATAMFSSRGRGRRGTLHSIMVSRGFQAVRCELESLAGSVEETQGVAHDLAGSFERVNRDYFSQSMPRPRLTWNRSITRGKFGHYNFSTDTVMISRTLDRPDVPAFVVDHVMHHELLHKRHGIRWEAGRGRAHTAEFRAEERQFARYHDAAQFLEALARSVHHDSTSPLPIGF